MRTRASTEENLLDVSSKPGETPSIPSNNPSSCATDRITGALRTRADLSGFVRADRWMVGKYES